MSELGHESGKNFDFIDFTGRRPVLWSLEFDYKDLDGEKEKFVTIQ